jgi:Rrf2 family iron-sulfur cluster assembly transcriptional regulator
MRLSITRKSDLALRALRTLAAREDVVRGEELAAEIGTTRGFLSQVMTPLARSRWVESSPGPLGGYRLRRAATPSVLDVIEAVEGPLDRRTCVLDGESECASARPDVLAACALHDAWVRAEQAMREELSRSAAFPHAPGAATPGSPDRRSKEVPDVS